MSMYEEDQKEDVKSSSKDVKDTDDDSYVYACGTAAIPTPEMMDWYLCRRN